MNKITKYWLIAKKLLGRSHDTFGYTFKIYHYHTKILFVYEYDGSVRVYLQQSDDDSNNFENNILIGLCKTQDDVAEIFQAITKEKLT